LLSQELMLSSRQIESMQKELTHWSEVNSFDLRRYETLPGTLPPIPQKLLEKHLDQKQIKQLFDQCDFARYELSEYSLPNDQTTLFPWIVGR
jgi:hypothetical protein